MTDFGQTLISGLDYFGGMIGTNTTKISNFVSEPKKGDGLVNRSNGQHTLQIKTSNLTANIQIEATLSKNPECGPWIPVQLINGMTGLITIQLNYNYAPNITTNNTQYCGQSLKTNDFYNITGNYAWLRANISNMSHGRIESIKISY